MSTLSPSAEKATVKYVGSQPFLLYGEPDKVADAIVFVKDEPLEVPRAVAEWCLALNSSLQAEVFVLADAEVAAPPRKFTEVLMDNVTGMGGGE